MSNNLKTTETASEAVLSLPALDQTVKIARRRLARLEGERRREAFRGIDRVLFALDHGGVPDGDDPDRLGFHLIQRLDQLIPIAEREVVRLEGERAAALLAELNRD